MQLKDYIGGKRRGKEANRIEREAMNDPFLQGALDGFDKVSGDHASIIEQLEKKYSRSGVVAKPYRRTLFYWSVAATILLLVIVGAYFFIERDRQDIPILAELQLPKSDSEILFEFSEPQPVQTEAEFQKKSLPTNEDAKVTLTTPKSSSAVAIVDKSIVSSPATESARVAAETVSLADLPEEGISIADFVEHKVVAEEPKGFAFRGKIVDETGEPLVGVSIMEKGTSYGTVTDLDGNFMLQLSVDDSSKLIASYIGYESKEINPSETNQTVALKPDEQMLDEVVVVAYGVQRSRSSKSFQSESVQSVFGEKEFQTWIKQKADKNVCSGKSASVNVSFFIDETGKPSKIEFKKHSCEEAIKEVENLLSTSPIWTKKNRKVTITVKW